MKNILIIQNIIPHYREKLYDELSKNYSVTVLHSGKKVSNSNIRIKELIVKKYKLGPFYWQNGVIKEVRSNNYDIIIAMFDIRWITNLFAMYQNNKSIQFIWWGPWLTNRPIIDYIKIIISKKNYPIIFYSKYEKEKFIRKGVSKKKLFVANNTIHVEKRIPSFNNKTKNSILFVGSLTQRKKVDKLIYIFKNILDFIPKEVCLKIIGDGKEKNKFKKIVDDLGIQDKVYFFDEIIDDNLAYYYETAIITCSLGQAGLSILQSFAYGVPFLTEKNAISGGEISNIKNGYNGILCDNDKSISESLIWICNNLNDSRKLGENAYKYYSEFCTIQKMVNGFNSAINFYNE